MDRYAVIGHPVAHSLSPRIHTLFAQQTGEALEYDRIDPGAEGFRLAAGRFFRDGGRGLNVTLPFKAEAFAFCDRAAGAARRAGVVNTLAAVDDGIEGHNTDGVGLVRDLTRNLGIDLHARRILLLGAGGAARGVLGPLLAERPAEVVVGNRTPARARSLAAEFADAGAVTGAGPGDDELAGRFDLVINATAAGLGSSLPPVPDHCLNPGATVYDMMYGPAAAGFLAWGQAAGAACCVDGLGMLVEQAAESFRIWRGAAPETARVLSRLRTAQGD